MYIHYNCTVGCGDNSPYPQFAPGDLRYTVKIGSACGEIGHQSRTTTTTKQNRTWRDITVRLSPR